MNSTTDPIAAIPRIALLMRDAEWSAELAGILQEHYTSLMLVTSHEKLLEFRLPFVVVTDSMQEIMRAGEQPLPEGSRILIISNDDPETIAVAFGLGAEEVLSHPFDPAHVLATVERLMTELPD